MNTVTDGFYPTEAPPLYTTEEVEAKDKMVVAHYSIFNSEWFVVEYDPETKIAFGYAILSGDALNSEWGYVSIEELAELAIPRSGTINGVSYSYEVGVKRDDGWTVKAASGIPAIRLSQ